MYERNPTLRTEDIARLGIGYVPEGRRMFAGLTVHENLRLAALGASMDRAGQQQAVDQTLNVFPALESHLERDASRLSGGQQQMVAIGRALICGIPTSSCPSNVTLPPRTATRPIMVRTVVVLPAPLRPSRVTSWPRRTARFTPCRMCARPQRVWQDDTVNLITGHTPPSAGTVQINGHDITGSPYHKVVRSGLVKSYQITTVFPLLDAFENVRIAAQATTASYVFWRPAASMKAVLARAEEVLDLVGLSDNRNKVAGTLSHGDQRRLDLAIALATDPKLLLLDEPTAGMSTADTEATVELIRDLNSRDPTILMIEHKMDVILGIADTITVLHQGTILFEGLPAEVQDHAQVRDVYLTGSV